MIGEICAEIRNYFVKDGDIHIGDWEISNGTILPTLDFPTNYIRIVGSRLNEGVHLISDVLYDEEFHGSIWIMSPPADFLSLVSEITEWQNKNGAVDSINMSPFQSESYSGYSYSKGAGGSSAGTSAIPTWQTQYAGRLNLYRRIREL